MSWITYAGETHAMKLHEEHLKWNNKVCSSVIELENDILSLFIDGELTEFDFINFTGLVRPIVKKKTYLELLEIDKSLESRKNTVYEIRRELSRK